MKKRILCVVLHYGDPSFTSKCLESIAKFTELDIVIVDNDPRQEFELSDDFLKVAKVVRTGGKLGFAAANNLGVNTYVTEEHDFILIINNDTVVDDQAIPVLTKAFEDDTVGCVGPCMPYADYKDEIWACGGWIDKQRLRVGGHTDPSPQHPFLVDYLPGAAIMVRSSIWLALGGLPEKYFLAFEEVEFALRVKNLGFKVCADPRAIIYHHVGMSNDQQPMYVYNSVRNRILFGIHLYGQFLGFLMGALNTLDVLSPKHPALMLRNLQLYRSALLDELSGVPLDRDTLYSVKSKFS